jgi:hypothetical protein
MLLLGSFASRLAKSDDRSTSASPTDQRVPPSASYLKEPSQSQCAGAYTAAVGWLHNRMVPAVLRVGLRAERDARNQPASHASFAAR